MCRALCLHFIDGKAKDRIIKCLGVSVQIWFRSETATVTSSLPGELNYFGGAVPPPTTHISQKNVAINIPINNLHYPNM